MDKDTLLSNMPLYYKDSQIMNRLQDSNAIELTNFESKIQSTLNQFFIDTADTSLERWEKEYGLKVDNNLDVNFRRSRIKAKKRGQGTITKDAMKNVLMAICNDADVVENNENYEFNVIAVNKSSIDIIGLEKIIEDIKPAHLGYRITIGYLTDLIMKINFTKYESGLFSYCGTLKTTNVLYSATDGRGYSDLFIDKMDKYFSNIFVQASSKIYSNGSNGKKLIEFVKDTKKYYFSNMLQSASESTYTICNTTGTSKDENIIDKYSKYFSISLLQCSTNTYCGGGVYS